MHKKFPILGKVVGGLIPSTLVSWWRGTSSDSPNGEEESSSNNRSPDEDRPQMQDQSSDNTHPELSIGAKAQSRSRCLDDNVDDDGPSNESELNSWIPYQHTNGVSFYHNPSTECLLGMRLGGEYMTSSIIDGSPQECVKILRNATSSRTTILGPASRVDILDKGPDKQVLDIQITITGLVRRICSPRQFMVECVQVEEGGVVEVLFKSVSNSSSNAAQSQGFMNWWHAPVEGFVNGGYTISPLKRYDGSASPKCLVTCIMSLDLGGWCGQSSWIRCLTQLFGIIDAFVERMLMSVLLLKDEIEQRRFLVPPFSLLGRKQTVNPPETKEDSSGPAAGSLAIMRTRRGREGVDAHLASEPQSCAQQQPHEPAGPVSSASEPAVPSLATLPRRYWSELHAPDVPCPFKVRGASYLVDRQKVPAGIAAFMLIAVDLVQTGGPTEHIARFLPAARQNGYPFSFLVNLIIPGNPILNLVATFVSEVHPEVLLNHTNEEDWQPFDFSFYRFLCASDEERNSTFKLIPRIAEGSWVVKQSVGTIPVIMGKKLRTSYYRTSQYFEVTVDVSSSSAAAYITGMVRGVTRSLIIDLAFLLEGHSDEELPESLIGSFRLHHLDIGAAKHLNTAVELPMPSHSQAATASHIRSISQNARKCKWAGKLQSTCSNLSTEADAALLHHPDVKSSEQRHQAVPRPFEALSAQEAVEDSDLWHVGAQHNDRRKRRAADQVSLLMRQVGHGPQPSPSPLDRYTQSVPCETDLGPDQLSKPLSGVGYSPKGGPAGKAAPSQPGPQDDATCAVRVADEASCASRSQPATPTRNSHFRSRLRKISSGNWSELLLPRHSRHRSQGDASPLAQSSRFL